MKILAEKIGKGCAIVVGAIVALVFVALWAIIIWSFIDDTDELAAQADAATAAANPLLRRPLVSTDGRIAFSVQHRGGEDLYVVGAGGAGLTRVVRLPGFLDSRLSWSPDGTRLAFTSEGEAFIVETVGADASAWRITSERRTVRRTWSPDGRRAVLVQTGRSDEWGVAIQDGASVKDITRGWPPAGAFGLTTNVVWSSDGQRLALVRMWGGSRRMTGNIYITTVDGSGFWIVGNHPNGGSYRQAGHLTWSPDGQRFAFRGAEGIETMAMDGSDRAEVKIDITLLPTPAWSPDSGRLAFSNEHGIVVGDPKGENLRELTRGRLAGADPAWSPDGTRIAFADTWEGKLHVMNADGSGLTLLAETPRDWRRPPTTHHPVWQPGAR